MTSTPVRALLAAGASGLLLAALLVAVPGAATATSAAARAAGTPRPRVSISVDRTRPIARESVSFRGAVAGPTRRVVLQRAGNGHWHTIVKGRTAKRGGYRFSIRAAHLPTQRYRVVAPTARRQGRVLRTTRSRAVTLRLVGQTARLSAPATATQGEAFGVTGTFTPVRRGRRVVLQRYDEDDWTTIQTGVQPRSGRLSFPVVPMRSGTIRYRVAAAAHAGAAAIGSSPRDVDVAPDAEEQPPATAEGGFTRSTG